MDRRTTRRFRLRRFIRAVITSKRTKRVWKLRFGAYVDDDDTKNKNIPAPERFSFVAFRYRYANFPVGRFFLYVYSVKENLLYLGRLKNIRETITVISPTLKRVESRPSRKYVSTSTAVPR